MSDLEIVALLGPDEGARGAALDRAEKAGADLSIATLMASLAVVGQGEDRAAEWLQTLIRPDAEERVLEVWDQPLVRRAGLALALRRGNDLSGGLSSFLFAELDILQADDPEDLADLGGALEAVAEVAPGDALRLAGACAEVTVEWLQSLPSERARALVEAYADCLAPALARDSFPEPVDANALLVLELLGARDGETLLTALATKEAGAAGVAARLVRVCVGVGLSGAAEPREALDDLGPEQMVDASEIRGMLDSMQIPYDDITGDSWAATLSYKGAFGERERAPFYVGLTAKRLIMRIALGGVSIEPEALLRQSRYTGLASFSLDTEERVCVEGEIAREGVNIGSFTQALDDMRRAIEWLVNQ